MKTFISIVIISLILIFYSEVNAQLVAKKENGKCGYCIEGTNDFVIRAAYDRCGKVVNGTMVVTVGKNDGLIDTLGNVLMDTKYSSVRHNGFNVISYMNEKGYMIHDIKGTLLLNENLSGILRTDIKNLYFISVKDHKYGFISEYGTIVQPLIYDSIFQTNNFKYYFFKENDKLGIMNDSGFIIHTPIFDKVNKVSNDSIMVKKDSQWLIWLSMDSTFINGQLDEPLPDILPCFDCSSCPQYGLNPRSKNHCSSSKLLSFIYKNLKYPMKARHERIEGTVVVNFIINVDGSTSDFDVKERLGYELDEAAIDVCKKLKFERAAIFEDQFILMEYKIPIKFILEKGFSK